MFITDIQIEKANMALAIAKRQLKETPHVILGLETVEDNVCAFVVSWIEGHDLSVADCSMTKQAKIRVHHETFELLI